MRQIKNFFISILEGVMELLLTIIGMLTALYYRMLPFVSFVLVVETYLLLSNKIINPEFLIEIILQLIFPYLAIVFGLYLLSILVEIVVQVRVLYLDNYARFISFTTRLLDACFIIGLFLLLALILFYLFFFLEPSEIQKDIIFCLNTYRK